MCVRDDGALDAEQFPGRHVYLRNVAERDLSPRLSDPRDARAPGGERVLAVVSALGVASTGPQPENECSGCLKG